MRKRLRAIAFCMMLFTAVFSATFALCENNYASIKEIRETLPGRWTAEYAVKTGAHSQLKKGDTVSIDVPIIVPEMDTVPIVRITWEPPVEGLNGTFEVSRDDWVLKVIGYDFPKDVMAFPVLDENVMFDSALGGGSGRRR